MIVGALLAATLSGTGLAALSLDAKYDLSCATAAAWMLSWVGDNPGDPARQNAMEMSLFYLGRLSGRDNATRWMWVVRDQLVRNRQPETVYSGELPDCVQRMNDKILTKAPDDN